MIRHLLAFLRRALRPALVALAGVALAASVAWFAASAGAAWRALQAFDARLLAPIGALVAADYALRFGRWRWLMREATGEALPPGRELALFFAGSALVLTPGRSGEWIRSVYAYRLHGLPVAQTAPIPLLERVVDVAAMLLLAGVGALVAGGGGVAALAAGVGVACGAGLALAGVGSFEGVRRRLMRFGLEAWTAGSRRLLTRRVLVRSFALGLAAWTLECAAFCLLLRGLGAGVTVDVIATAFFIYPIATLAGTVSFLPGGLGVTEGGIAGMLRALLALEAGAAASAALLIRVAIIAPGIVAGLAPLLLLGRESLRAGHDTALPATDEGVVSAA